MVLNRVVLYTKSNLSLLKKTDFLFLIGYSNLASLQLPSSFIITAENDMFVLWLPNAIFQREKSKACISVCKHLGSYVSKSM